MQRQWAVLLMIWVLLSHNLVDAAPPANAILIVQYKDDVVEAKIRSIGSNSAAVAAAAVAVAEANAASAARGVTAAKRDQIAEMAKQTAMAVPALALMTSTVTSDAVQEGIQVVGETNFATVIHGAAIKTRSARDAELLKQKLQLHPAVQNVWYAVSLTGAG